MRKPDLVRAYERSATVVVHLPHDGGIGSARIVELDVPRPTDRQRFSVGPAQTVRVRFIGRDKSLNLAAHGDARLVRPADVTRVVGVEAVDA